MDHLECERHNFHLLFLDYLQQYSTKEMFHFKEAVKETISNKIIIY